MKGDHIFLVGFMGSGKTAVGRILANRLGREFIDTDAWIEDRMGKKIHQIFNEEGEAYFRGLEHKCLAELLLSNKPIVISTGGGMFESASNRLAMEDSGVTVYLHRNFRQIFKTIRGDHERPLAASKNKKELYRLYKSRNRNYQKAQWIISNSLSPEDTAGKILSHYGED